MTRIHFSILYIYIYIEVNKYIWPHPPATLTPSLYPAAFSFQPLIYFSTPRFPWSFQWFWSVVSHSETRETPIVNLDKKKKRRRKEKKKVERKGTIKTKRYRTSFVSLISIPNSFFNCLFSSWRDSILFLAMERSSFIRAFVVVNDSTLAWRLVTVALKSTIV